MPLSEVSNVLVKYKSRHDHFLKNLQNERNCVLKNDKKKRKASTCIVCGLIQNINKGHVKKKENAFDDRAFLYLYDFYGINQFQTRKKGRVYKSKNVRTLFM